MNGQITQEYLSLQEVAIYLGIKPKTLHNWKSEGKLPFTAIYVGTVLRFKKTEIDNYLEQNSIKPKE